MSITNSQILIVIALSILLVLSIYWEAKDYQRIQSRPHIKKIHKKDQKKELEFYACFNAENNIQWRGIFIMTLVATLLILYVIYQFYGDININMAFLIFVAIILVFYIGHTFKTFHLYREMCSKVKTDKTIL
uniref:3 transmembrane helices protein n=1 Tax=Pithovirus LCPAC302 TaxID=2506593 RepID=A0A481Z789_9VIRU|nr:MAG: 3 transmembrane helices protein [Pithovirus LCPAC302]